VKKSGGIREASRHVDPQYLFTIKELVPYMKASAILKVVDIKKPEAKISKHGASGIRSEVILGDNTGIIKGSLWGKNLEKIEKGKTYLFIGLEPFLYYGQLNFKLVKDSKIIPMKYNISRVNKKYNVSKPRYIDLEEIIK